MIYQLEITLQDVWPPVWRRLKVPADITMAELHRVIQIAMGWTDAHLHQYVVGGESIGAPDPELGRRMTDEHQVRLVDVALGKTRFGYEYDFGDGWRHEVVVETVLPDEPPRVVCLDGARACPPEDCGGPTGYEELLQILADPSHEEHAERLASVGGSFDPEAFDVDEVNGVLRRRGPRVRRGLAVVSTLLH